MWAGIMLLSLLSTCRTRSVTHLYHNQKGETTSTICKFQIRFGKQILLGTPASALVLYATHRATAQLAFAGGVPRTLEESFVLLSKAAERSVQSAAPAGANAVAGFVTSDVCAARTQALRLATTATQARNQTHSVRMPYRRIAVL